MEQYTLFLQNQESSEVSNLLDKIIAEIKGKEEGIYNIYGNWKNHSYGYSAIVQKANYDNVATRISGSIYAFDGNGWNFTANILSSETSIKSSKFTMS